MIMRVGRHVPVEVISELVSERKECTRERGRAGAFPERQSCAESPSHGRTQNIPGTIRTPGWEGPGARL